MTAATPRLRTGGVARVAGPLRARAATVARVAERVVAPVQGVLEPLTTLGWVLLGAGLLLWLAGALLAWVELLVLAATALLAVVVGMVWTLRPSPLAVDVELLRQRVVVGREVTARAVVTNAGRGPAGGRVELPVGDRRAVLDVPVTASGGTWQETLILPTDRRSVVDVGPASAVRGDPLGVARRERTTGLVRQLFVHPETMRVAPLDAGRQRDLEGQTTQDLSPSDVAFHTLREYVPGDDRRHIHWRTSARIGKLLVRQFVDTRRSHLGLVLPCGADQWQDQDAFELGVSVLGSIGTSGLLDGRTLTVLAGASGLPADTPTRLLDGLAGVDVLPADETGTAGLDRVVRSGLDVLADASIIAVVTGTATDVDAVRRSIERLPRGAQVVLVRCRPGGAVRRTRAGRVTVLEVGSLPALARACHAGVLG